MDNLCRKNIVDKLKLIKNHKRNTKIITIKELEHELYQSSHNGPHSVLSYDDGKEFEISCDSLECGAIEFYFDIKSNPSFMHMIDNNLKKYIEDNMISNN